MTTGTLGAARLRALLDKYDVSPRKALSQNFVIDPNTIDKVITAAGVGPNDRVLEIGSGAGSLTIRLAAAASHVTSVELDSRLMPVLQEVLGGADNVEVVEADALHFDLARVDANLLVANLPYNIAATVVLRVLTETDHIRALTVMTQKEVGERLTAGAGSKTYGQTSVMVAYFGRARIAGRVSKNAFWPIPSVDSVIVKIERSEPPDVDRAVLFAVVRAAFSQRRKTQRNSLSTLAGSAAEAEVAHRDAGLDPALRAEQVDLGGFLALARSLA
ncbi:MAG: 16S rRNA (adenine(1518)-N(6)/adenine(1519)-N(6))-dimethyltransferase RsmA [Actinomycetota bacterium]